MQKAKKKKKAQFMSSRNLDFYLFIFGCAGSSLLCGLSLVAASSASHCRARGQGLGMWASVVLACGL